MPFVVVPKFLTACSGLASSMLSECGPGDGPGHR